MTPPPWRVGVVIPARDEAAHIAGAIAAVREACAALPDHVRASVVVVADRCRDDTAGVARAALGGAGTVVTTRAGSVGVGRSVGVAHVLRGGAHPLDRFWLANTDADSLVPPGWLVDQLALADDGAAAVAGTVAVDSFAELADGAADEFRRRYAAGIGRGHTHVHGANLGVRADAYCDAGGWHALATGEDHDLWRRLRRRGWPVRAVVAPVVTTSGRLAGRAPRGFALGLQELHREAESCATARPTGLSVPRRGNPASMTSPTAVDARVGAAP